MLPRTRHHLTGPPFALPGAIDHLAEAWFRARPRTRLIGGVTLAVLALLAGIAHAAATPDGPPTSVWVATHDLLPGESLSDGDTERRSWPADLVPEGALERPTGTVSAALPRGAVVTELHLSELGVLATVPPERVAVAVPIDQLPSLAAGVRLDLVGPGPEGGGVLLAAGATVLANDGTALWLSIEPGASLAVSAAVASGSIAAVVLPPAG
jgi:hypothetical protein